MCGKLVVRSELSSRRLGHQEGLGSSKTNKSLVVQRWYLDPFQ